MNPIEAISSAFNKFATLKGRASRSEYWWYYLFFVIVGSTLGLIPIIGWAIYIVVWIPFFCVGVRRLHDVGLSGWWLLIFFAPFVIDSKKKLNGEKTYLVLFGFMYFYKILITAGEDGENAYGPNPLHKKEELPNN